MNPLAVLTAGDAMQPVPAGKGARGKVSKGSTLPASANLREVMERQLATGTDIGIERDGQLVGIIAPADIHRALLNRHNRKAG